MLLSEHLAQRRLLPELYSNASVDEESGVATFALWSMTGQMVGFQQYRPGAPKSGLEKARDQRYFTFLRKEGEKHTALSAFGVELLDRKQRVLFMAEGVFDVSPLHQRGVNALDVLTINPKPLKGWLRSMGYYLVSLCEGDKAGRKLAGLADESVFLPEETDPAEQSDEWFDNLVSKYK